MRVSEQADLSFYPDRYSKTPTSVCSLSRLGVLGVVLLFVISLLVVGLAVGLAGRQRCPTPPTTALPPTTVTPSTTPGGDTSYRLPQTLFPSHYDVTVTPDLERAVFTGKVIIKMRCVKATQKVVLNMDSLNITNITLEGPAGKVDTKPHEVDKERVFLIVPLLEPLKEAEEYTLTLEYTGELLNNLMGLYRSSYKDANGKTRYFVATQFESTRARRALPCFDEPLFKAEFTVTIGRRPEHNCLSNMPSVGVVDSQDGWEFERFNRSVRMSTYLLAMYVGDLESRDIQSNLSIKMRIWARPDGINKTDYVQFVADKEMAGFQRYFNISYSLPKMDHVGLPEMGPGAMENWGLIKYREKYVIVDENSTPEAIQSAAFIFAHELGHQWFGNLVTMKWWDDIWLNEGFANLCEYIGVEYTHREWKPWEQFIFRTQHAAMTLDSLRNSRVIRQDVNTPSEISGNFDAISYRKGSSIMRMLRDVMGHETFRRGITRYLNKHKFNNTVSEDLWDALSEQMETEGNPLNVTDIMHPWTLQMNYPLITVTRDYISNSADVTQTRFLLDNNGDTPEPAGSESQFGYTWEVPLTYTNQASQDWATPNRTWMHRENVTLPDVGPASDWVLMNVKRTGMYRVNYDRQNWKKLDEQLTQNHEVFPTENRAQLVDDALQLARAGLLPQSTALDITRFLAKERDLVPWRTASLFFSLMYEILIQTEIYGDFRGYVLQIVNPLLENLGWEDTGEHLERMLRVTAVRLACQFEHPTCVKNATLRYRAWMENPDDNRIPEGLRGSLYCSAIRDGGEKEWDFAWEQFQNETDPLHRSNLRDAMACTGQPWLLSRYLSWAGDPSKVRRAESSIVLVAIARNPVGRHIFWSYIQQSWPGVYGKKRIADNAFDGFFTETDVQELETFRDKYADDHGNAKKLVAAAVEKAWVSRRWMARSMEEMGDWFRDVTGKTQSI